MICGTAVHHEKLINIPPCWVLAMRSGFPIHFHPRGWFNKLIKYYYTYIHIEPVLTHFTYFLLQLLIEAYFEFDGNVRNGQ